MEAQIMLSNPVLFLGLAHIRAHDREEDLSGVDFNLVEDQIKKAITPNPTEEDMRDVTQLVLRSLTERDPGYGLLAGRLLSTHIQQLVATNHPDLRASILHGIKTKRLDPRLKEFDLDRLNAEVLKRRANTSKLNILAVSTLADRYLLRDSNQELFEDVQMMFMRVAMGLAILENDKEQRTAEAIEFYKVISDMDYMPSTPTLFNAGTLHPQLSSCYLTTIPDDLPGIYEAYKENALLSKWAGGLGNDWTPVRAMGARIQGTNGESQGVVPFLAVQNASCIAVNQGGKRKGAACAYLETWHADIEEFLDLRKNTGDDRRRTHDMNTANWVPDEFMRRVAMDEPWYLMSPDEVGDLHDLYGKAFAVRYAEYVELGKAGKLNTFREVRALDLWRKMLSMLFETGHPWITFKDACNLRSPQQHVGVVHSSNLCTEITLNTSETETAVCNLGSINLVNHVTDTGAIDLEKLEKTVSVAVRMLDNVVDINFYPTEKAKRANSRHRPIGLGVMGMQDALYKARIPYASKEAVSFSSDFQEAIACFAITASAELARDRGKYSTFEGSLWSRGIFPQDSAELLMEERHPDYVRPELPQKSMWAKARTLVAQHGMRNSNVMAIAPTATISNICGVSQSIEPTFQNLFVKSNLSGEFTVLNPYLVADLKKEGLWNADMVNQLKRTDGSVQNLDVPQYIKDLYSTAFELDMTHLIDCNAARQYWVDQSISLNVYLAVPTGAKLHAIYMHAFDVGLKTTYYLRSKGATSTEKATYASEALNAVARPSPTVATACSIDDPDCEACQ